MSIRLSDERCEEIKQEVVNLFERYNINCVPISGFEIASKMGIKVMPYSSKTGEVRKLCLKESQDGFSIRRGRKWYIFYNDDKQFGRINNTMLHEIGHIVLDHTEDSELAEKEVKFFAKYALVPPVLVHKLKLTSPEKISETFDVSYEAACYALVYYNKWLRYSGRYYKPYEEQLLALFSENTLSLGLEYIGSLVDVRPKKEAFAHPMNKYNIARQQYYSTSFKKLQKKCLEKEVK